VAAGLAEALALTNEFAAEHLALHVKGAEKLVPKITSAGAVFVGSSTPEAVGDYVAGPSHVLPTAGTARFASPLSVVTFRRRMSVLDLSPKALAAVAPAVEALATAEGLQGHWRAVKVRVDKQRSRSGATRGTRAKRSAGEQGPALQGRVPDGSAGGEGRHAPSRRRTRR